MCQTYPTLKGLLDMYIWAAILKPARYTTVLLDTHKAINIGPEVIRMDKTWYRLHNNYKVLSMRSVRQFFFLLRFRSILGKVHALACIIHYRKDCEK